MPHRFCPSVAVLMRHALSADDPAVAAHVAGCEPCGLVVRQLAGPGEPREAGQPVGPDGQCLDELTVARIADGGATASELDHLGQCANCRGAVSAVAAAMSEEAVAAEIARLERAGGTIWFRRVLAIAAAAAAITVAVSLAPTPVTARADAVYRDAPPVAVGAPLIVAPADVVTGRPARLIWRPMVEARQYRVTVFDAEGSIEWAATTADTVTAIPSDVPLAEGVAYWWRVEARIGFDRWARSELASFSVGRAVMP